MKFTGQTRKHELTLGADREGRVSAWLRNGAPFIKERGDQRGEVSGHRKARKESFAGELKEEEGRIVFRI